VNHCWVDERPRNLVNPPEWWTVEYLDFFRRWEAAGTVRSRCCNCDFIINTSDFPVAPLRGSNLLMPVLSATRHPNFADIAIPTPDDVEAISGKVYMHLAGRSCRRDMFTAARREWAKVPWGERAQTAIFRGTATGCGTTAKDNPRLRLAQLAHDEGVSVSVTSLPPLFNVGLTSWYHWAPRRDPRSGALRMVDPKSFPFGLADEVPLHEQSRYRYIINVEGYVAAFRYPHLLNSGSTIINVRSEYGLWFEPAVVPGTHVVQVADVADVADAVRLCRTQDATCRKIAKQAKDLHHTLIEPPGPAFEYMTALMRMLS
jgi:hypothetical protein